MTDQDGRRNFLRLLLQQPHAMKHCNQRCRATALDRASSKTAKDGCNSKIRIAAAKLIWLLLLLLLPQAARSGGVVTECTEADLRAALAGGGTITFACDGTILLTSTITNTLNTTLDGRGHQITISGGDGVQLFCVATNTEFRVVSLTLAAGYDMTGAAILNLGGRVELSGVILQTNQASSGGAIGNRGGVIIATDCVFRGNRVFSAGPAGQACGGAVDNESGTVELVRCNLTGNSSIGVLNPQPVGMAGAGGAIFNSGTFSAVDCVFSSNAAMGAPGCFWGDSGGAAWGGAIYNTGLAMFNRCTFASNSATGGNGLAGSSGIVVFEQGLPGQNGGSGGAGEGGALYNLGTATLINCTLAGNTGWGGGGASGGNGGGGAAHWGGNGGNGGDGGAGCGGIAGSCQLTNCTLAWNSGRGGTSGVGGAGGAGIYPGSPGSSGSSGSSVGTSLGATPANILSTANNPGGSDTITNALLRALGDYGGLTPTVALLPGSPAINAGNNAFAPSVDQRNLPRPFGGAVDLGAYEYATLLQIRRGATDGVEIEVRDALPNQPCRLLTATALTGWSCVSTNWVGTNGTTLFQRDATEPQRFFKVVMP